MGVAIRKESGPGALFILPFRTKIQFFAPCIISSSQPFENLFPSEKATHTFEAPDSRDTFGIVQEASVTACSLESEAVLFQVPTPFTPFKPKHGTRTMSRCTALFVSQVRVLARLSVCGLLIHFRSSCDHHIWK
jgi:hypothetical protein